MGEKYLHSQDGDEDNSTQSVLKDITMKIELMTLLIQNCIRKSQVEM